MAQYFGSRVVYPDVRRQRTVLLASSTAFCLFAATSFYLLPARNQLPVAIVPEVSASSVQLVEVLAPSADISVNTSLSPTLFKRLHVPADLVRANTIRTFEEVERAYARTLILKDQPLQREYITTVRPWEHIVREITEGNRAVTIPVDVVNSVGGFASPGMHVDVQWITQLNGREILKPLVQNALVLAAGGEMKSPSQGARTAGDVTLSVTADDADKITLALRAGTLSLVLRGEDSPKGRSDAPITVPGLLGEKKEVIRPDYAGTAIINGSKYNVTTTGRLEKAEQ